MIDRDCEVCKSPAAALVSDRFMCEPCGYDKQRALVLRRMAFLYGEELKDGAYVRIIYRVGPRYEDARRYGRIIETQLFMGLELYLVGMPGHGPRGAFLVRLESGEIESHYPEHLAIITGPKLKAIKKEA